MTLGKDMLFFLSGLGAFNGLILGIYFLRFAREKGQARIFLGIVLLVLSIRIGKSVLLSFQTDTSRHVLQIGLSACFLIGPALFLYLRHLRSSEMETPLWKSLVGASFYIILAIGLVFPYNSNPDAWNGPIIQIIYGQWAVFSIASLYLIRDVVAKALSGNALDRREQWMLGVIGANAAILTCYLVSYFTSSFPAYISAALIFSVVTYLMVFFLFIRRTGDAVFSNEPTRTGRRRLDDHEVQSLKHRMEALFESEAIHRRPDLKLGDLATALNVPQHSLSHFLNESGLGGFSSVVNRRRIADAKELIQNGTNYSLEAIGHEVGFNSKSAFYTAFKKETGTTPAKFKSA